MADTPDDAAEPHRPDANFSDAVGDDIKKRAEAAADKPFQAWWKAQAPEVRFAVGALIVAVGLGPLGMSVFSVIKAASAPTPRVETLIGIWWLFVLTLPLFAGVFVLAYGLGKHATSGVLILAAVAAIGGGMLLGALKVPDNLGDLYCYATLQEGVPQYEEACRVFRAQGFVDEASRMGVSPSRAPAILMIAFAYVTESRGVLMAICGAVAGVASGYLVRRSST